MNKKAEFDALWNWSKTYMYQSKPTHPSYGFFSWSMKLDGTPNSESPAPDGEEYWAMALYFAANRWGNGKGIYDYQAEADRLLDFMKNRKTIDGPTNRAPETGAARVPSRAQDGPFHAESAPAGSHGSLVSSAERSMSCGHGGVPSPIGSSGRTRPR